jgi:uncharacterized protein (TIGR03382 family)
MPEISVSLWAIATIGGPVILAAALAYGVLRQRRRRHRQGELQPEAPSTVGHERR